MSVILAPNKADREPLLRDDRVERLWERLQQELKFDDRDQILIGSYVQPEGMIERKGLLVMQPAQAVFVAQGVNPRDARLTIMQPANCRLTDWQAREDETWRFVRADDPAYEIFRELVKTIMRFQRNLRELDPPKSSVK